TAAAGAGREILKEQQPPAVEVCSPPSRDTGLCHRNTSPRSSLCSHNRLHPSTNPALEKSLVPTQDPEQSLTEYIHRLERIQQRLGAMQPGKSLG
ncbi:PCNT protein, partial [Turnix velox]|nr:PCNT protein [Turnix velox]